MTFRSKVFQTTRALWRRQNLSTIATARSTSHVAQRHAQHHPILSERGGSSSSQPLPLGIVRRWHSDNSTSSSSSVDTTKVGNNQKDTSPTTIHITFLQPDETKRTVDARVGETILITAHRNEIDLEGACEGRKNRILGCSSGCMLPQRTAMNIATTENSRHSTVLSHTYLFSLSLSFSVSMTTILCDKFVLHTPPSTGVCACSTCHLIFPHKIYDTLPEPSEEEEDMLDMAFGLTETSRLGCQVIVTKEMDGMLLQMPKATRNFYVDGHVPKPH